MHQTMGSAAASQGNNKNTEEEASFRDSISTVTAEGKRKWIYPKKPKGRYTRAREIVATVLLAILFIGPFLRINGEPLLMLNVVERRFVIFGQIFLPSDLWLFALVFITGVVFIALFTVVFGRLFCGWVCPQTIFMEMVFRKIEYAIEGDRGKQIKLNRAAWTPEKIRKKTLKHAVFFLIAFLISNTFLAYIIGSERLIDIVTDPPSQHLGGLIAILIFSGVFYSVFAFFREQVCTTVCPYGRLQGVLLDQKSVVVAYDHVRGEPRGRFRKNEDRDEAGKGDCIDCHQCVDVCPTGIDIRNGTQMECVNCTACIDACDAIMDKIGKPRGLIRYDSEEGIEHGQKFRFTGRMAAYSSVLLALLVALTAFLGMRSNIDASILRARGQLYQKEENGTYSNLFNYTIKNRTNESMAVNLKMEGSGRIEVLNGELEIKGQDQAEGVLFVYMHPDSLKGMKTPIRIGIYSDGKKIETVNTSFFGPNK